MTLDCIWLWGSSSGDLESVEYSYIVITPWSTLPGVVVSVMVPFISHIGLLANYLYWKKWVGWIVCLLSNRKKRVSRNWTRGINFKCCCYVIFLIESEQPNFYTENIPFCLQPSSSSPTTRLVSCESPRLKAPLSPSAFRQDLNNHTKMPHRSQSHNVVIYMRASV